MGGSSRRDNISGNWLGSTGLCRKFVSPEFLDSTFTARLGTSTYHPHTDLGSPVYSTQPMLSQPFPSLTYSCRQPRRRIEDRHQTLDLERGSVI